MLMLLSTPSRRKLFCCERWPLALKSPVPPPRDAGRGRDAGGELGDVDEVASVERRVVDGGGADDLADGGLLGLQQRRGGVDGDALGDGSGLQLEVDGEALLDVEMEVLLGGGLHAGRRGAEAVVADLDGREDELSDAVRFAVEDESGVEASESHIG